MSGVSSFNLSCLTQGHCPSHTCACIIEIVLRGTMPIENSHSIILHAICVICCNVVSLELHGPAKQWDVIGLQ